MEVTNDTAVNATKALKKEEFIQSVLAIQSFKDLEDVRARAIATENLFRELFAKKRDSWEIPEIDDPFIFLINVFKSKDMFRRLSHFEEEDLHPRCFPLDTGSDPVEDVTAMDDNDDDAAPSEKKDSSFAKKIPAGAMTTHHDLSDFQVSWDCFSEGLLRFLDWDNVFCAGGAVAGCLAPLPEDIKEGGISATRMKRRKYFHDTFLPSSDIDLFLYALTEEEAEAKLIEIYDAIQAANPYQVRAFRSAHAVTLVSQYPFRHVQIILRLYNSPAEVLMGFDVDACAVGYNGRDVYVCPRTALAMVTQSNMIDMSRRSPSYEMRLAKYAQRGYEVVVPSLNRDRVDPFIYEKRFEQIKGLARLLMLERLRTPMERLRYRIEAQLKIKAKSSHYGSMEWIIQAKIRALAGDNRNVERAEGVQNMVPATSASQMSNYCTVFLPWGPNWTANKIERLMKKKDRILNKIEFTADGTVKECERPYKVHVCAVGTMEEVMKDPFPDDPPIPEDTPEEDLESTVHGKLSWLVDNPGRQQIGSFHPITESDWTDGAYISKATEAVMLATISKDTSKIEQLFAECKSDEESKALLTARDFLGRSVLHVAALTRASEAAHIFLKHKAADSDMLKARLPDGRTALHLCAIRGDVATATAILEKRKELAADAMMTVDKKEGNEDEDAGDEEEKDEDSVLMDVLDIDGADWEVKLSPLQYSIVLGHVDMVKLLLAYKADAQKLAVHKNRRESLSVLTLLAVLAAESGERAAGILKELVNVLMEAGCSTGIVDTSGGTIWHRLAVSTNPYSLQLMRHLAEADAARNGGKVKALDVIDDNYRTPLYLATVCGNHEAISILLEAGVTATFEAEEWDVRAQQVQEAMQADGKYSHYSKNINSDTEDKRCPIAFAARNVNTACLKAFLEHDAELVRATVRMLDDSNADQRRRKRQRQVAKTLSVKVLDLVEQIKKQSQVTKKGEQSRERNIAARQRKVVTKSKIVQDITANKNECERNNDRYKAYAWSIILRQEELELEKSKQLAEQDDVTEEDEEDDAAAAKQIEEALELIKFFGGQNHPDMVKKGEEDDEKETNPNRSMNDEVDDGDSDPFHMYCELVSEEFSGLTNSYDNANVRGEYLQDSAFDAAITLLSAAAAGDASAVTTACEHSKVCITDFVGATPFFLAARSGSVECAQTVFEAAKRQHRSYKLWQKSIKDAQAGDGEREESDTMTLKNKLKRLNNLEIAAGETPKNTVPTPDMMRRKLGAAADAADNQKVQSAAFELTSSKISSAALLLHRSIVLTQDEPSLAQLKEKLHRVHPYSFSEWWKQNPVRLNALELAVIKGNVGMVKALIEMVANLEHEMGDVVDEKNVGGGVAAMDCDDGAEGMDCDNDEEEEEENEKSDDDDDDSGDDSADDDGDEESHGREKVAKSLTYPQLRFVLFGESSTLPYFGNMTLLQLAMAVDNVEIFELIANFAKEFTLPRAAIAKWKRKDDERRTQVLDQSAKKKIEKETNEIHDNSMCYNHRRAPNWASSNPKQYSVEMCPTLLQFALGIHAANITRALLAGEMDKVLLDWIYDSKAKPSKFVIKHDLPKYSSDPTKGVAKAAKWVCTIARSGCDRETLAYHIIRPNSLDGIGRNALFYAPADAIAQVVQVGVRTLSAVFPESNPEKNKDDFCTVMTSEGWVDALKAACSAREVDRIKALVAHGAKIFKVGGPKNWSSVHFAIPTKAALLHRRTEIEDSNLSDDDKDRMTWQKCRDIIEALLERCDEAEATEALLGAHSEHSPLMVAIENGADGDTITYFINKLVSRAKEALAVRDSDLNTLLHLCTQNALGSGGGTAHSALVALVGTDAPDMLSPNVENSGGTTPIDLALQAIVSIWGRAAGLKSHHSNDGEQQRKKNQRRNQLRRPNLPRPMTEATKPSLAKERKTLAMLEKAVEIKHSFGKRATPGFEEVKVAKNAAAIKAKKEATADLRRSRYSEDDGGQVHPDGPPALCMMRARRHGQRSDWPDWPRISLDETCLCTVVRDGQG